MQAPDNGERGFMIEAIGLASTVIAIAGVCMNNRRLRWCFALWWISNLMTLAIHAHAGIWSLALRDLIFFVLAVEGWILWKKGSA
jgi:nicotinamide riboside transporter PnuC